MTTPSRSVRRHPASLAGLLLGAALILAADAAPAANLLVNGSFETGPNPGVALFLPSGSTALPGWVVTGLGVDYVGTRLTAAHGQRTVALNGIQAGGIRQTIPTIPLAVYTIYFWMSGDPLTNPEIKHVRLSAARQSGDFSADTAGMWEWDPGWNLQTLVFTADSALTTIRFTSLMSGDSGPVIDSVFVALTSTDGVTPGPVEVPALSAPAPNPAREFSRVDFHLDAPGPVTLCAFDVAGRLVATLADGPFTAGQHDLHWDGRGTDGPVPAGLYYLVFDGGGRRAVRRLTWVR